MKLILSWPHDRHAELARTRWETAGKRAGILKGAAASFVVKNVSPTYEYYNPFEKDALYKRLAACGKNHKAVLQFVRTFGLLRQGHHGPLREQPLCAIFEEIKALKSVVDAVDRRDWGALEPWLNSDVTRRTLKVAATFRWDSASLGPSLFFEPMGLISAIYLQLFQDVTNGAQLKLCARPGCGEWFKYGSGTGRRETAEYCDPRCQKAHAYQRQKEGVE
jgi:hypothetical protein